MVGKRRRSVTVFAALGAALLALLAVPAFAAALTYEVDNNGDGSTKALCVAHITNECTLRGALEAAEADPGLDIIEFSNAVFDGQVSEGEIGVGSTPLPAITQPLTVSGHFCNQLPGISAPCVGVTAHTGEAALKVESSGVTIKAVAFGGGKNGIEATGSATGFKATGDWFGLKLDATANAISLAGILLKPGADEATVGGNQASERNVFANARVGVEVVGASKTKILGNYLGAGPTGTGAASLEEGVRIVDAAASPAEENEVGGTLSASELATQKCVGPCNVIATTPGGLAIDLAGEAFESTTAASGPTVIRGNYLGLGADGSTLVGNSLVAVLAAPSSGLCVAGPGDVTVGGLEPGDANFIEGGIEGIYAEAADNFRAIGNAIGIAPDGSASASPEHMAIALCNSGVSEPSRVAGNRMMLGPDTVGVASDAGRAQIVGNSIKGGLIGVLTAGESTGAGDLIQGNSVTGTDNQGILIAADSNVIVGNTIIGSEWSGIEVEEGGEHNRVGGDLAGEANTINEAGHGNPGSAIAIEGAESSRNEVAANTGFGNAGAFIELLGHSHAEIPNGLAPPTVSAALQSSATGTAVAGTKVRVFSKATSEAGELGGFLGFATTDSAGVWKATFATVPVGTLIAATQTSNAGTPAAGTSEVSAPVAATADPTEPEKPSGGGSAGGSSGSVSSTPPPPPPAKAPKVKITAGPKKSSTSTTAKFKFKAEPAAGARFECKLDNAKWAKCGSPKTYRKLKPGKHTFQMRASASGLASAATRFKFTVQSQAADSIARGPGGDRGRRESRGCRSDPGWLRSARHPRLLGRRSKGPEATRSS